MLLEVKDVALGYKDKPVIKNLSFTARKGEILGILGKNGIGKSTLLYALVELKKIDAGEIKLETDSIGYVPDNQDVYNFLRGKEILQIVAEMDELPEGQVDKILNELAKYMKLPDLELLMASYSKGNKEKMIFLLAILKEPDLLVMDEPFSGFDPKSTMGARHYLKEYAQKDKLVVLSTHVLEMAAQICDRVLILLSEDSSEIVEFSEEETVEARKKRLEEYMAGEELEDDELMEEEF